MPSLADVLGRRGFFEAPMLRELLVIDSLATQCMDAYPQLRVQVTRRCWRRRRGGRVMCMCMVGECGWGWDDDGGSGGGEARL